ncbi:MAG: alpha/beta fold hydrolase, partial [Ancalomicrobiaceae bacterium]|nr:alpha/beta fold hydrolase [Ancalomicrobiaceae bacterium]
AITATSGPSNGCTMKMAILLVAILALLFAGVTVAVYATAPRRPPPIASIERSETGLAVTLGDLPRISRLAVTNGAPLAYRLYPGQAGAGVVVLVHGSSGHSVVMHPLARALAQAGITVYAVDLRGHGETPPLGDIDYAGQLDDDIAELADFAAGQHPGERRLLIGHSLGGGFALRIATGLGGNRFAGFIALSPFIAADFPGYRPLSGGWANVSIARILVLSMLDRLGFTAFDWLPVIAYAVPETTRSVRTATYSHRLLENASFPRAWREGMRRIVLPARVIIGADDELFDASAYPAAFADVAPAIPVTLVKGVSHMGMILDDTAIGVVVTAAQQLLGN